MCEGRESTLFLSASRSASLFTISLPAACCLTLLKPPLRTRRKKLSSACRRSLAHCAGTEPTSLSQIFGIVSAWSKIHGATSSSFSLPPDRLTFRFHTRPQFSCHTCIFFRFLDLGFRVVPSATMANSVDNALARFLYAILKQKNLKDIDWNQVAHDDALIDPCPNGHAARMRYSRYKSTIEKALESGDSHKRSRTSERGGVTKPKKGSSSRKGSIVKSESGVNITSLAQFSPASVASSVFTGESRDGDLSARFLTPCSDDMTYGITAQPGPADFPPPGSQFLDAASHDPTSPSYSAFNAAFDLGTFDAGCDLQASHSLDLGGNQALGDWSDRFHDPNMI